MQNVKLGLRGPFYIQRFTFYLPAGQAGLLPFPVGFGYLWFMSER